MKTKSALLAASQERSGAKTKRHHRRWLRNSDHRVSEQQILASARVEVPKSEGLDVSTECSRSGSCNQRIACIGHLEDVGATGPLQLVVQGSAAKLHTEVDRGCALHKDRVVARSWRQSEREEFGSAAELCIDRRLDVQARECHVVRDVVLHGHGVDTHGHGGDGEFSTHRGAVPTREDSKIGTRDKSLSAVRI